jgi:hypothetical protein
MGYNPVSFFAKFYIFKRHIGEKNGKEYIHCNRSEKRESKLFSFQTEIRDL